MKILATVLLGPGSHETVGDAIRSVKDRVHGFVLIESGGGAEALRAAREAAGVPHRCRETVFFWTGDYAAARQYALDQARECGADYAITLDPDERLELPEYLPALLEAHREIAVWTLVDRDEGYHKERIIRCDSGARWHGRVCENVELPIEQDRGRMRGQFWELPKDEAGTMRRYERGVVETRRMIDAGDDRYKWRRHLGSCLLGLGRRHEAVEEFQAALALAQSPEERAWASYLLCEHEVLDEQYEAAQARAADALRRHAGFLPEFGWILAYCQWKAGEAQNASRWAQLVLNTPPDRTRVSFRSKQAKTGCAQILAAVHGPGERARPREVELRGVKLPITDRYSPTMVAAVESGAYEAAEHALLAELLEPGDRLLELGTGCGYLATVASQLIGSENVVTVEADLEMGPTIDATVQANGVRPTLLFGPVSRDASPRTVDRAPDFWSTRTRPGGDKRGYAFDELLDVARPTVLLCDIEGDEADLVGTELPDALRAIIIEVHSTEIEGRVSSWLRTEGFALLRSRGRTLCFTRARERKAA